MKQPFYFIVFSSLLILGSCTQVEISQWRGPNRDGIYPEKNLLTEWPEGGPQLLWKYDSLGCGYSSAVVTSKRVFTVGMVDSISYVFSFDIKGNLLWKKPLGLDYTGEWPGIYSTPTIYKNLGYIVNGLGVLYCFDAENGDILWNKDLIKEYGGQKGTSGFLDNLILDGEKLYTTPSGIEKNIVALNSKTGEFLWASTGDTIGNAYCSPLLIENGGKDYFIYQTNKSIISLDANNGEIAWTYRKKGITTPNTPIYRKGFLITPDYNNGSVMLKISNDGHSISEIWKTPDFMNHMGDAIVLGDRIYGRGKKNKIYCIDWNTGQEIYSESAKTMVTTLISAENLLYCYDIDGDFHLLQPLEDRFEKRGSFKVMGGTENHCSHPVIKEGKLYIRHDNSLFVYNIAK